MIVFMDTNKKNLTILTIHIQRERNKHHINHLALFKIMMCVSLIFTVYLY